VGWRTDFKIAWNEDAGMKTLLAVAAFAFTAAMPGWQVVHAQGQAMDSPGAQRHRHALALEHRGDDQGAFIAFLDAAEQGYPPAQRRLGEIYDSGNSAVKRNYEESIRWYQMAREGGEQLAPLKSPMPTIFNAP
jgi:TPR repeat protein